LHRELGKTMKHLCLVYHEETKVDALFERAYNAIVDKVLDYREELRKRGHDIASSPLQPVRTATIMRVGNDAVSITDGPFADTKNGPNQAVDPVNRLPGERVASDGEAEVSSGAQVAPGMATHSRSQPRSHRVAAAQGANP
jgi:hypothetical protein